jgi:alpha,alpha-trehalase
MSTHPLLRIIFFVIQFLNLKLNAFNLNTELNFCNSKIYCTGDLLHTIQMSNVFNDSKTFVDMPSKFNEAAILENFSKISNKSNITELKEFLDANFYESGYDVIKVEPVDWTETPEYINRINDSNFKELAYFFNVKWKHLLRKFDRTVLCDECTTSALVTNNPFIVPGGRFIEFYYWDTYFILEGLLISGMTQTARGILEDFLNLVDSDGFIPNGPRVYYLNRSQPPLLTHMVSLYLKYSGDFRFVRQNIHLLDKEYTFWFNRKAVIYSKPNDFRKYQLNIYDVDSKLPRPESYREDYVNARESKYPNQEVYYSNVMTAAESGFLKI